jgi:DNA-binding response OmpR family regulator
MGSRIRSLVFEDNDLLRSFLKKALERRGHEVFVFPDPVHCRLGLNHCSQCNDATICADIIFSSIEMIHSNGLDFFESLIQGGCKCSRFVLMSSNWSKPELHRARALDCKILTKPIHISDVLSLCVELERELDQKRELTHWGPDSSGETLARAKLGT